MAPQIDLLKYIQQSETTGKDNKYKPVVNGATSFINSILVPSSAENKIQSGVNFAISTLLAFGTGEDAAAAKEVSEGEKAANNLDKSVKTTTETTNKKVEELLEGIVSKIDVIQENIKKLEDASKQKEEYQAKIEEAKIVIEENKKVINDPLKTKEERIAALNNIKQAGLTIEEISFSIENLLSTMNEASKLVQEAQKSSEESGTEIETTLETGAEELQNATEEAVRQQSANVAMSVEGTTNNVQGAAAEAKAIALETTSNVSSFIPVFGAIAGTAGNTVALRLQRVATDQFGAGNARINGATSNFGQIMSTYQAISSNLLGFQNFSSYALGSLQSVSEYSDSFNNICEPLEAWCSQAAKISAEAVAIETESENAQRLIENEDKQNNSENEPFKYDTEKLKIEV